MYIVTCILHLQDILVASRISFFFSFHGKMKILYSRNIEKEFVGEEIKNLIENAIIIFGGKI